MSCCPDAPFPLVVSSTDVSSTSYAFDTATPLVVASSGILNAIGTQHISATFSGSIFHDDDTGVRTFRVRLELTDADDATIVHRSVSVAAAPLAGVPIGVDVGLAATAVWRRVQPGRYRLRAVIDLVTPSASTVASVRGVLTGLGTPLLS